MSDPVHDPKSHRFLRYRTAALAAVLLAAGGGVGAVAMRTSRPSVTMAPIAPVAISSLSSGIVTIKGQVAEIYGNKFIVTDGSGKALVETGREGEGGKLVTSGETVTVQGRFERGFVHAAFLLGPDNKVVALGPLGGPPRRPHGGPGAPPPPPPGAMRGAPVPLDAPSGAPIPGAR